MTFDFYIKTELKQKFNNNGFTLIEVIITLLIIGICAGLCVGQLKISKVDGAAKMIYYDLQYTRMQAISKNNDFSVVFNIDQHSYEIKDDGVTVITKDIHNDFKGVTITLPTANPTYNSGGTSNSGTITVTKGSDSKAIKFSWTGRIRIE